MSKPKKRWWNYVRRVLYDYPEMTGTSEWEAREQAAVCAALDNLSTISWDGVMTRRIVEAVFFKKTHTIGGAAQLVHVSEMTARRRVNSFIVQVGRNLGFD